MANVRSIVDFKTDGSGRGFALGDRYALAREVKLEGLGQAFLADDTEAARQVVAVTNRAEWVGDPIRRARFEERARALQSIEHANLVTFLDFGIDDGVAYAILERAEGERLADRLARKRSFGSEDVIPVMSQLLKALEHLHARGLIARSLCPANVFLFSDGVHANVLRLMGAGLTELLRNEELPDESALISNPSFAAPEQLRGLPATPACDVYAAGRLMETMLQSDPSLPRGPISQRGVGRPTIPASARVPQSLLDFISRATAPDPALRPANGAVLVEALIDAVPSVSMLRLRRVTNSQPIPRARTSTTRGLVADVLSDTAADESPTTTDPAAPPLTPPAEGPQARGSSGRLVGAAVLAVAALGAAAAWLWARPGVDHSPGATAEATSVPVQPAAVAAEQPSPRPPQPSTPQAGEPAVGQYPERGSVRVLSEPEGTLSIDGVSVGPTPYTGELAAGTHLVEVTGAEGSTWSRTIEVRSGSDETWSLRRSEVTSLREPAAVTSPRGKRSRRRPNGASAAAQPSAAQPAAAQPAAAQPAAAKPAAAPNDPFLPRSKKREPAQSTDLLPVTPPR